MANILVIYGTTNYPLRATTHDHLYCFRRYSGHRCFYLNLLLPWKPWYRGIPRFIKKINFDLVIFHVDLLNIQWPPYSLAQLDKRAGDLRDIRAVKVALTQDEFYNTDSLDRFINEYDINYVFSLAAESEWPKIYPTVDFKKVKFVRTLPGYLDERRLAQITRLAKSGENRSIDIGYRAYNEKRQWLGQHGFLKIKIAQLFGDKSAEYGLVADISTCAEATFLGNRWYEFLLHCKYTIAVEGGASVLDHDGSIRTKTEAYLVHHPQASFEDVEKECFPGLDGGFNYKAISPKHLEACATRTCQVLIEGEYNGILIPGVHYIELKSDFSNINQVLEEIKQDNLRLQITERAYKDIVESGLYSYSHFVKLILEYTLEHPINSGTVSIRSWLVYANGRLYELIQWIGTAVFSGLRKVLKMVTRHLPSAIVAFLRKITMSNGISR